MMNPQDNERLRGTSPRADFAPAAGSGWIWIVAVMLAVFGLALLHRHGANNLVMIPVGVSLFFMFMFMLSHRSESRRLQAARRAQRMAEFEPHPSSPSGRREALERQAMGMQPALPSRDDGALRRVFDRYDLKVIEHGRSNDWDPKQISSLLEMSRDFVDTQHAGALLNSADALELDRHLDAALERALLQFDIAHERKGDNKRPYHASLDTAPF